MCNQNKSKNILYCKKCLHEFRNDKPIKQGVNLICGCGEIDNFGSFWEGELDEKKCFKCGKIYPQGSMSYINIKNNNPCEDCQNRIDTDINIYTPPIENF